MFEQSNMPAHRPNQDQYTKDYRTSDSLRYSHVNQGSGNIEPFIQELEEVCMEISPSSSPRKHGSYHSPSGQESGRASRLSRLNVPKQISNSFPISGYDAPGLLDHDYLSQSSRNGDLSLYPEDAVSGVQSIQAPYGETVRTTLKHSHQGSLTSFGSSYGSQSSTSEGPCWSNIESQESQSLDSQHYSFPTYETSFRSPFKPSLSKGSMTGQYAMSSYDSTFGASDSVTPKSPVSPQYSYSSMFSIPPESLNAQGSVAPDDYMYNGDLFEMTDLPVAEPSSAPVSRAPETKQKTDANAKPVTLPCPFAGCKSEGKFRRPTDLRRHVETVHNPKYIDCKVGWCGRVKEHGFTRRDHYLEHLREVHKKPIAKATKKRRIPGVATSVVD